LQKSQSSKQTLAKLQTEGLKLEPVHENRRADDAVILTARSEQQQDREQFEYSSLETRNRLNEGFAIASQSATHSEMSHLRSLIDNFQKSPQDAREKGDSMQTLEYLQMQLRMEQQRNETLQTNNSQLKKANSQLVAKNDALQNELEICRNLIESQN
jgi:hypothetical protein